MKINSKKILIISHCFWPEIQPINEVVKNLSLSGNIVHVLTGKPNYPYGKIYSGYSMLKFQTEIHESGYKIFRVPIIPRFNNSHISIFLNYFSFIFFAVIFSIFNFKKKDSYNSILVFATSPVIQAIVGIFLKIKLKIKLVLWVQDLRPSSLYSTGYIKNKFILK